MSKPRKKNNSKQSKNEVVPYRNYTRGRSGKAKEQRRAEEIADTAAKVSRSNPVQLYTKYSMFARDAATFPFANPVGIPYKDAASKTSYTIPGVMRIRFVPSIGVSKDFTSPLNRSSINFWSKLRSAQKASSAYDHQDITMMELSVDSCIMYHSMMKRIYGILTDVSPLNLYYPKALVAACGVDFNDITQHIQDFRAYINEFAYRLTQYTLPSGIALFERHQWMCEGLYTDSQTTRAQTYMFVPQGFWQYDNTVTTGSQLAWKDWLGTRTSVTQHTYSEMVAFGNALLNAMSGDEDFATISGDLKVYYGTSAFGIPYIEEGYRILPKYDQVVLSQIENATLVGEIEGPTLLISQNPNVNAGAIIFTPKVSSPGFIDEAKEEVFMNFHHDSPTPDQVIEASRLITTVSDDGSDYTNKIEFCGTEICTQADIFAINPSTLQPRYNPIDSNTVIINVKTGFSATDVLNKVFDILHISQFDWAPRVKVYVRYEKSGGTEVIAWAGQTWDVDNMANVPKNYIGTLNDAAMWSLFEIPVKG